MTAKALADDLGSLAGPDGQMNGPGWYESSWDLRQGLVVHERLPLDATLDEWLDHHVHDKHGNRPPEGR